MFLLHAISSRSKIRSSTFSMESNQVQVHPKAGLTFESALPSILRQDPDVIMIGELRDRETAEIARKASQSGHMVLSTLHTNDSVDQSTRGMFITNTTTLPNRFHFENQFPPAAHKFSGECTR
jgi:Flp pilus assembly CpaF family ATPase